VRRESPDDVFVLVRESLIRVRVLQDKFAFVAALVPLAAAAALKGEDVWTARILGAGTPLLNARGSPLSIRQCGASENKWNETRTRVWGPINGGGRMRPAAARRSIRC
jgi:hypothetical protein